MKSRERYSGAALLDSSATWTDWNSRPPAERIRIGCAVGWIVIVSLAFIPLLTRLMRHAAGSELHSYIPLVPFVTGYLLYRRRDTLSVVGRSSTGAAVTLAVVAGMIFWARMEFSGRLSVNDDLALMALSYITILAAGGFFFLGSKWMIAAAFPISFLIFIAPLPDAAVSWLEDISVLASADVAAAFFNMTGTPLLRDGTIFTLPTIVLRVAQECSGIHSSWVLFITSLLASDLFLKTTWRRIVLVLFVIPLGVIRNGFRILVIGLLCVHIGPQMIDSIIHRRGGPFFFVLSLVPLFGLLSWLRRQEISSGPPPSTLK